VIFYQQRIFAAISLVCASFPSASYQQMYKYGGYGKYKGEGGGWSLVDLRNVCSYVFHFPDKKSHNAEKSCQDLRSWLPIAIRYTKITMPRKQLIEFICRKQINACTF
jgi:hypothetical protein